MDYELAKELKEAGFPQKIKDADSGFKAYSTEDGGVEVRTFNDGFWRNTTSEDSLIYIPTLKELIIACGNGFVQLSKLDHTSESPWAALGYTVREIGVITPAASFTTLGRSAEEAISRLWLAINNK